MPDSCSSCGHLPFRSLVRAFSLTLISRRLRDRLAGAPVFIPQGHKRQIGLVLGSDQCLQSAAVLGRLLAGVVVFSLQRTQRIAGLGVCLLPFEQTLPGRVLCGTRLVRGGAQGLQALG